MPEKLNDAVHGIMQTPVMTDTKSPAHTLHKSLKSDHLKPSMLGVISKACKPPLQTAKYLFFSGPPETDYCSPQTEI
jgi:hypothetical protein